MEKTTNINITGDENDLAIVVDMQNDFVTGALGTKEAQAIVPGIVEFLKNFKGKLLFTRDTHQRNYLETQEGRNLPVTHTVEGTEGWEIVSPIMDLVRSGRLIINKPSFGSLELADIIARGHYRNIYFVGVCTGICVISNAVIAKAADPEAVIHVIEPLCACVTPESHATAIAAMRLLQMDIIGAEQEAA